MESDGDADAVDGAPAPFFTGTGSPVCQSKEMMGCRMLLLMPPSLEFRPIRGIC